RMRRLLLLSTVCWLGCSAVHPSAELAPLALAQEIHAAAPPEDHFNRDTAGGLTPQQLRELLAGPVFLEAGTRLGVVPVESGYEPGAGIPLPSVPAELTRAVEGSGEFEMATEVTTDWPTDRGVSGLRELAARYRTSYLLL